jgi:uncharacterized protein (DUF58 family)
VQEELFEEAGPLAAALQRWLTARRRAGLLPNPDKGAGLDFEDLRPWQPGDDFRHIDWNTTARTGVPHIRTYRQEKALTAWILLDISASMALSAPNASHLGATLLLALTRFLNLATGLLTFSDQTHGLLAPTLNAHHLNEALLQVPDTAFRTTNPEAALTAFLSQSPKPALVLILSDGLIEDPTLIGPTLATLDVLNTSHFPLWLSPPKVKIPNFLPTFGITPWQSPESREVVWASDGFAHLTATWLEKIPCPLIQGFETTADLTAILNEN